MGVNEKVKSALTPNKFVNIKKSNKKRYSSLSSEEYNDEVENSPSISFDKNY